jgi:hypothetical protein
MQVGTADAASRHLYPNFAVTRLAIGELGPFESPPKFLQHHRVHDVSVPEAHVFGIHAELVKSRIPLLER